MNDQIQLRVELSVYVQTMLVGPKVRIFSGHRLVGSGETIEEAANAARTALEAREEKG